MTENISQLFIYFFLPRPVLRNSLHVEEPQGVQAPPLCLREWMTRQKRLLENISFRVLISCKIGDFRELFHPVFTLLPLAWTILKSFSWSTSPGQAYELSELLFFRRGTICEKSRVSLDHVMILMTKCPHCPFRKEFLGSWMFLESRSVLGPKVRPESGTQRPCSLSGQMIRSEGPHCDPLEEGR